MNETNGKGLPVEKTDVSIMEIKNYPGEKNIEKLEMFLVEALHYGISILLFYFAFMFFRYGDNDEWRAIDVSYRYNYYVIAGYAIILLFFNRTYNAYLFGYNRIRSLIFAQFISQFFTVAIVYFIVSFAWNYFSDVWPLVILLAVQLGFDILWSWIGTLLFFRLHPPRRTILIYRDELDRKRFGTMQGKPMARLYKIQKELQFDGSFREIKDSLTEYDAVFVAGINSRCRNGILKYCKENGVPGFFLPHIGDMIMQEARHIQSFDSPVLYVNRKENSPEYVAVKRLFDILFAAVGLVVLSPVMVITAVAIRLYDGGPAFYRQVRLTKGGREFRICKFRSMRVDAEKDGIARLSTGDKDDRITPIGRFVRKCRLDELPQLFNILKGDMSIVGPRPERPEIAAQYYHKMPDFRLRLQVKAGLTGYAQVYGKYNTDPYEKLEFDLMYINQMSILTDLKLMFATFAILFSGESTTGVEAGAVTALDDEEK